MKPTLFTIGPFSVFAFGFFLALAFLFATYIVWKHGREELKEDIFLDGFLYTSIGALFSARIFYIVMHFSDFQGNFLKYLVVREAPGLSLFGGVLGGAITLYLFCNSRKLSFLRLADIFSLAFTLGLIFVKIGEFFGGAAFGSTTKLPWGVRVIGLPGRRHPVEIYEVVLYFLAFLILSVIFRRVRLNKWFGGFISLVFLMILSLTVFLVEFVKERSYVWLALSMNQILALIIIFSLLPFLFMTVRKMRKISAPT